jgi:catechol 2,3-dioxygenase
MVLSSIVHTDMAQGDGAPALHRRKGRLPAGRIIAVALPGHSPNIFLMDAINPSANATFASRTPLHIGAVGLAVRDLDKVADFYRDAIGLEVTERSDGIVRLGAGEATLLELTHKPNAKPDDARSAGLFHTAFLMPTRKDLAQWVVQVARDRVPISGYSDHAVSEAFYLDDPEGNGVEVYSDRPPETWQWIGDNLKITTDPLDVGDLLRVADADATYGRAPAGLRIGHIHLRVGDVATAEKFYRGPIGLDLTRGRGGAAFMSSGRYHHHLATNVWHSSGAGERDPDRAGLAWYSFEANDAAIRDAVAARLREAEAPVTAIANGFETQDPWRTRVRFVTA